MDNHWLRSLSSCDNGSQIDSCETQLAVVLWVLRVDPESFRMARISEQREGSKSSALPSLARIVKGIERIQNLR